MPTIIAALQQTPDPVVPAHEHRTGAYTFMQQAIQPVDFMSDETNTHMISTLNWVSPSMDFNLAEFGYNSMDSREQYWSSPHDVANLGQGPSWAQSIPQEDGQSHTTSRTLPDAIDAESPGTAYVDDRGARQPRSGRYANRILGEAVPRESPRSIPDLPVLTPEPDGFNCILPHLPTLLAEDISETRVQSFTLEQYRSMGQAFQNCCLVPNSGIDDGPFYAAELPPMPIFDALVALYRRHFDPKILPMVHFELDVQATPSWVVKLAMSAIGSQYLETYDPEFAVALHEFLRRVLRQRGAIFSARSLTTESLILVQSKLLNYIGLAYCGSRRLEGYRTSTLEGLVGEYASLHSHHTTVLQDKSVFQDGRDWVISESARRLAHTIWFLDSMSRYHFGTQPKLLLDFADIALPCKEDVWQAETDQMQALCKQVTLEKALRVLYVEKRLLKDVGDFSRVLLIHGLYCQTWDVAKSFNRPLLRWTPSARKGDSESQELTGPTWLPRIPLYNHWRNAACDSLDVLHWIANSDIAKTGTENSTVLHLHFARIVLLAPYDTIRELAQLLVSEDISYGPAAEQCQELRHAVRKWITDDQFKARLALVHCGVFFWHVRRYSTDAFYEPTKVFLATLVVWAYGSLCPPQQPGTSSRAYNNTQSRDEGEWSSDVEDMSSIRLDRPTDDELVQIFIKRGRSMTATIMGVGNITASNGPPRMLREGCRLLRTLNKWPVRHQYLHILTRLIGVCGRDRLWLQTRSNSMQTPRSAST